MAKKAIVLTDRDWVKVLQLVRKGVGSAKANFNPSWSDNPAWKKKCQRVIAQVVRIEKAISRQREV